MVLTMKLWTPEPGEPELFEWWQPLVAAARAAMDAALPWPLSLDRFQFAGRIDRAGKPAIYAYAHVVNHGWIFVDPSGQAYEYVERPGRAVGAFRPVSLAEALRIAAIDRVEDARLIYDEASPMLASFSDDDGDDDDGEWPEGAGRLGYADGSAVSRPVRRPAARRARPRHLRLVPPAGN